jgi:hypothetical protein
MPTLAPVLNPGGESFAPEETGCVIEAIGIVVLLDDDVDDVEEVEDTDVEVDVGGLSEGGGGLPDPP